MIIAFRWRRSRRNADWLARLLLIAVIGLDRLGGDDRAAHRRRPSICGASTSTPTDNLLARKHVTQVRVLLRAADVLVIIVTFGAALMTFEPVRQYGVSLFASAGVAGIVAGLAARPVLTNLFAGVQLAMTQPIRIDDAVIVENEWGTIEEITSAYVVVRLWDLRRMIVPLTYFIEKPFQNWTRESSALIGSVLFYLDYRAPIGIMREKLKEIAASFQELGRQDGQRCKSPTPSNQPSRCAPHERASSGARFRPALRGAREDDRLPAKRTSRGAAARTPDQL